MPRFERRGYGSFRSPERHQSRWMPMLRPVSVFMLFLATAVFAVAQDVNVHIEPRKSEPANTTGKPDNPPSNSNPANATPPNATPAIGASTPPAPVQKISAETTRYQPIATTGASLRPPSLTFSNFAEERARAASKD